MEDYEFSYTGEVFTYRYGELAWYLIPLNGYEVYGDDRIIGMVKLPEDVYVGGTDIVDCPPEKVNDGMKVKQWCLES